MKLLNLGPQSKHRKCAKICGDTSGDFHPHGEAVIYPTLVRLAQDWVMRYSQTTQCYVDEYNKYTAYAAVMVVLYPAGVPLLEVDGEGNHSRDGLIERERSPLGPPRVEE